MALSYIKIFRVFWLNSNSKSMSSASTVHSENVNPVLILINQPFDFLFYISQLSICKETFINRLLAARRVSLEKVAHTINPPVVCNVIGYKIKRPFHSSLFCHSEVESTEESHHISQRLLLHFHTSQ